jgi:mRNA interferase MazF
MSSHNPTPPQGLLPHPQLNPNPPLAQRGEVWQVDLTPGVGAEMQKDRPCVVVSGNHMGILPLKLVVPLTGWKANFSGNLWHVKVDPSATNGISKASAADVLQMQSLCTARFLRKRGQLSADDIENILAALAIVTEMNFN